MPVITCGTPGAEFFICHYGSKFVGGAGETGAKIDAEVTRTGLSADVIGPKVLISHHASTRQTE